jgi:hypothetical protein
MSTELAEAMAAMIAERATARTEAFERRRTATAETRQTFKLRRKYGLERRHAAKLARNATRQQIA